MLPIELLNQTSNFSSVVSKHSKSRKIEYFTISLNLRFLISIIAIFNICFPTSLLILYIKHRRKMTNEQHLSLFRCANVLWTTTVVALGPSQSITCSSLRIAPALPSFHGLRPWQELHTISFHNKEIPPTTCATRNAPWRLSVLLSNTKAAARGKGYLSLCLTVTSATSFHVHIAKRENL